MVCIDQQAGLVAWMIGFEEGLAGREILDGASVRLEHLAEPLAYMAVVVDDEDDLPEIVGPFTGEMLDGWRMPCGSRRGQKALDGLSKLLQPHRLVELDAVMTRNIAQRACRYITGQDDDRDPTMKLRISHRPQEMITAYGEAPQSEFERRRAAVQRENGKC